MNKYSGKLIKGPLFISVVSLVLLISACPDSQPAVKDVRPTQASKNGPRTTPNTKPATGPNRKAPRTAPTTTNKSAHCKTGEIHTVIQPVFSDRDDTKFFTYSFRIIKSKNANAPTIIYLPGGPGAPSMESKPSPWMENFNYVYTDVRGSGCNEFHENDLPNEGIRTEYASTDIAAIVDYLGDREKSGIDFGKYMIHGCSYGTVLATVAGHQIENSNRPKPQGIVLEGILGKKRDFSREYQVDQIKSYVNQIIGRLPQDRLADLENENAPYGLSKEEWMFWLEAFMAIGSQLVKADDSEIVYKHSLEVFLASPPPAAQIEKMKSYTKSESENGLAKARAYENISCQELWQCKDIVMYDPFESSDYQLKTPLYYFQGTFDPRTLMEEARYHFDRQDHARKYFVVFKEGGHSPLQTELRDLAKYIFERIASGRGSIELLFDKMISRGIPVTVEVAGHRQPK